MTRNKRNLPEGDDGRSFANMNVEGMPWYSPEEDSPVPKHIRNAAPHDTLDKRQTRYATWGALKAALLVCAVYSVGIVLFVLFCIHVWFK